MRRSLDVLVAGICLILLVPLMLAIVACIFAETGRPVFFLQTRLGRNGTPFRLIKFRKFHPTVGTKQLPLTLRDDPRFTRVGRILERSKLDELPQLWNILKGEMAIVGPRPESLSFADCFVDSYRAVLAHPPGIFGPSQALFRDESALYRTDSPPEEFYRAVLFPAKARIDLAYYPSRSVLGDLMWGYRSTLAVLGVAPHSIRDVLIAAEGTESVSLTRSRQPAVSAVVDGA